MLTSGGSDDKDSVSLIWMYGYYGPDDFRCFSMEVSCRPIVRAIDDGVLTDSNTIVPLELKSKKLHQTEVVAVDGSIYFIAGTDEVDPLVRGNSVERFDTKHPDDDWSTWTMEKGRCFPRVADLDRKIYIFGGTDNGTQVTFSEVLDTVTGELGRGPNEHNFNLRVVGVDRDLKRIVFLPCVLPIDWTGYDDIVEPDKFPVFFFYPRNNEWVEDEHPELARNITFLSTCSERVLVGTIIYWFMDRQMKAYDFDKHKYYLSNILWDLPGYPNIMEVGGPPHTFLFQLEGEHFCLVWVVDAFYNKRYRKVFCTTLHVSKDINAEALSVQVLATNAYYIDGGCFDLCGAAQLKTDTEQRTDSALSPTCSDNMESHDLPSGPIAAAAAPLQPCI